MASHLTLEHEVLYPEYHRRRVTGEVSSGIYLSGSHKKRSGIFSYVITAAAAGILAAAITVGSYVLNQAPSLPPSTSNYWIPANTDEAPSLETLAGKDIPQALADQTIQKSHSPGNISETYIGEKSPSQPVHPSNNAETIDQAVLSPGKEVEAIAAAPGKEDKIGYANDLAQENAIPKPSHKTRNKNLKRKPPGLAIDQPSTSISDFVAADSYGEDGKYKILDDDYTIIEIPIEKPSEQSYWGADPQGNIPMSEGSIEDNQVETSWINEKEGGPAASQGWLGHYPIAPGILTSPSPGIGFIPGVHNNQNPGIFNDRHAPRPSNPGWTIFPGLPQGLDLGVHQQIIRQQAVHGQHHPTNPGRYK